VYLADMYIETGIGIIIMFELNEKNLAHYTIQRRLAQGGMSQVFLAYDEHEKRDVAIKVVNRCEDDYVVRFARPTVQTAHPQNKANTATRQSNPGGGHRHRHDD